MEHLRCRILEEISEFLFDIQSSGETEQTISTLALGYTRGLTGTELLAFTYEVLPLDYARRVEGFLASEYPLLHASVQASSVHAAASLESVN